MTFTVEEPGFNLEAWSRRNRLISQVAQTARCDLALRYFDIRQSTNVEDANWQPFQLETLNRTEVLTTINKSRQIGMSFTIAGDELMDGMLKNDHAVVMLSFNLEEAREKILYAKKWWESRHPNPSTVPIREEFDEYGNWRGRSPMRLDHWPELVKENSLELYWSNGFRMISHPCRPPRGKRASVVLDEFGHYQHDGPIFTAGFPMITRGRGRNRMTIASTPLGANGKFWEIHTNEKEYPDFARFDYGWWEVEDLCERNRRLYCMAEFLAGVPQTQLVQKYGTRMLKMLYNNVLEEDFQQEYGLQFLDALHSFIPWDLIKACYPDNWVDSDEDQSEEFSEEVDWEEKYEKAYVAFKARAEKTPEQKSSIENCLNAVFALADAVKNGEITGPLAWAFDCGRDNDPSEITVYETKEKRHYQRLLITLPQVEFDQQEIVIRTLLDNVQTIVRGMLDKGGIGRDLVGRIQTRYGDNKAQGVWFDNGKKEMWALTLKRAMERHVLTLIPDRDQEQQFHSIRRKATSAKHMVYELDSTTSSIGGGRKVKHHGDKFWVSAMATFLCEALSGSGDVPFVPPGFERHNAGESVTQSFTQRRRSDLRSGSSEMLDLVKSKTSSRP